LKANLLTSQLPRNLVERKMSNMVERSSISLKVKKSFSSRYKKKKQFFDVLSYQKFHKLQYQDRQLKRLELLHEQVLKKQQENCKDDKEDKHEEDDEFCEDEEDVDNYSSSSDFISESEDEMETLEEEEYLDSDEYEEMEEEAEYDSDENLLGEFEDDQCEIFAEGTASTEETEESDESHVEGNVLVDYELTDDEVSVTEDLNVYVDEPDLENNGNEVEENLNEISNIDELNVSVMEDDDVEALMAMQFRDTRLQSHIREHNLNLVPREATRNDGNCWYDAIADQIVLHEVPDKPTNHVDLRRAVCEAIPKLPQAKEWVQNLFGNEDTFTEFLDEHRVSGIWTDSLGIMCQATALYVGRNIHIVGTANIGQGFAFTKLESVEEAENFPPFTVGYYQDRHYQSLQERPLVDREAPQEEHDVSLSSDQVRRMIDEERLLDESVFESDSDFDDVYQSEDDLDSFDNNFINSDDSVSEMLKKVDKIRESKKDDTEVVEPTVKLTYGKSRNLLNRLF